MKHIKLATAASIAALMGSLAIAKAAVIEIDNSLTPSATGFQGVANPITNDGTVAANANDNTAAADEVNTGEGDDPSAASVAGNLITALATGNNFDAGVDLELINDALAPGADTGAEGIALITRALNTGVVSSTTNANRLEVSQVDFTTGSLENVDNLISAQTTLNRGSSDVTGQVPSGYTPTQSGSGIAFDSGASGGDPQFTSNAVIATGSVQLNTADASGSSAAANGNEVLLTVAPTTTGDNVSGALALDRNTIESRFTGNTASSLISVEAGGDPAFTGTAALSNIQANQGLGLGSDPAPASSAEASDNTVQAIVGFNDDDDVSADNTLTGALSVSDNTITASATGNAAPASNGSAGNRIVLADSLSFDGTSDIANGAAGSDVNMSGGNVAGNVDADLGLFNFQANQGGDGISSLTDGNTIGALAQNLDSGSIVLEGNTIDARARGNTGSNAIDAGGTTRAAFDGTAALASAQVNLGSDTTATASGSTIEAQVGNATDTSENSVITAASVTLANNLIAANAIANQVSNSVDLGAASLSLLQDGGDLGNSMAVLTGGDRNNAIADSTAGASITNVQANFNSATTATNSAATLRIDAGDLLNDADGVDASNLRILGGVGADIDAVAAGISASNSLSLAGNQISGSAGLNNLQVLGETAANNSVTASVTDASVEILADTQRGADAEGITDSTLAIRDVGTRALAYGTTAANTVNVDAGSGVTLANDGTTDATPASVVNVNTSATDGQFFDAATPPTVTANFALLSNQSATADNISSTISSSDPTYRIQVGGDADASSVEVENNALSALAFGNQSTNAMALDLGNVTLAAFNDSTYAPVANVTNVQSLGADTTVEATINTGGAGFEAVVASDVTGSTVSVSDNTAQAQAFGNRASDGNGTGNRLTVTGGEIVVAPTGDEAALSGISLSIGDGANVADAAFSVQNAQSGANAVIAGLDDGDVPELAANMGSRIAIGGDVVSSSVLQDGNAFSATAINNQAINDLSFEDVTTMGATGGIANFQVVSSTTSSSTGVAGTEPTPGTPDEPFAVNGTVTSISTSCVNGCANTQVDAATIFIASSDLTPDQETALLAAGWITTTGGIETSNLTLIEVTLGTLVFTTGDQPGTSDNFAGTGTILGTPPSDGKPASKAILASIGGNSGSITDSTVSVSENMDMATTRANDAINRLNVDAVTLEPGRGDVTGADAAVDPTTDTAVIAAADHSLGNYQLLREEGTTDATAAITLGITVADPGDSTQAVTTGSSLTVDDNRQQADAIGNNAVNRIDISGTNTGDLDTNTGGITSALASFQVAEDNENVSADSWMEAFAPASLREGSSLSISGNETLATATVNRVDNASTVDVNTLAGSAGTAMDAGVVFGGTTTLASAESSADHALLSQQQAGDGELDVTATLRLYNQELNGSGDIGIVDSSVTMSGNTAQATGRGNVANNLLSLEANTLGATGVLANAQLSDTEVGATATGNISLQMNALDTAGDVSALQASSVELDANRVIATAEGNRASNELALDASAGYGALTVSAAIANLSTGGSQVSDAPFGLASYQGNTGAIQADAEGSVLAEFASNEASVVNGSTVTINENLFDATATANAVSNRMEERAAAGGNASLAMSNGQINEGAVTANAGTSTTPLSLSIAATGSAGTSDVIIVDSALAVLDNLMLATARGNTATNVMDAQVGPQTTANAEGAATASDDIAVGTSATYALFSGQRNTDSVTAGAVTEIGVSAETTNGLVVDSSAITLAGNVQQAVAVSNNVINRLMLSGTNSGDADGQGITSSLASWQEQTSSASATSDLSLSAPAQLTGSSMGITDNASVAMAVLNEANNMASIDFTNLGTSANLSGSGTPTQAILDASETAYATADHLVSNIQLATGAVSSTASLEAINQEAAAGPFANGVDASTIGIMGNVAQAQSVANLANTTLNLNADARLSATGGVVNFQDNGASVAANATGTFGTALDTTDTALTTLDGSSVRVDDNRVVATGVGNQARNVLNVTAGAGYENLSDTGATASGATGTDALATASFAVLNAQYNTAGVTATVNGSAYANFTGTTGPATVDGSSLSVSGNRFAATATGNSATNLMTASTLPTGTAGMALTSSQVNTGNVTATANDINIGVNTGGVGTQGSMTSIGGNAITASATGNVVSSRLSTTSRF